MLCASKRRVWRVFATDSSRTAREKMLEATSSVRLNLPSNYFRCQKLASNRSADSAPEAALPCVVGSESVDLREAFDRVSRSSMSGACVRSMAERRTQAENQDGTCSSHGILRSLLHWEVKNLEDE